MKKVLIITYYWPPTGGSGVQRWLKFCKYLPSKGWTPIVYTPANPQQLAIDHSLEKEISQETIVIKRKIFEPYQLYQKLTGKKGGGSVAVNPINNSSKKGFMERLSLWLRANLFIPDPRMGWVKPSVKYLSQYLKEHPVDAIVSTGPPHSMHLIARELHRKTGIRWIADFRDPWTRIFYFKHLPMSAFSLKKHRRLELSVLSEADAVVSVTEKISKEFEQMLSLYDATNSKVTTISNGFDEDDFSSQIPALEDSFTITHTGLFSCEGNPLYLWRVLSEMVKEDETFAKALKIRLIGKTDGEIISSIREVGLEGYVENMGYLPHSETSQWQQRARVLILPLRNEPEAAGILTGKFFEYLAAGRAVVAFGPEDGELAYALEKSGAGKIFDFSEYPKLKAEIERLFSLYLNKTDHTSLTRSETILQYSRSRLTTKMAHILEGK